MVALLFGKSIRLHRIDAMGRDPFSQLVFLVGFTDEEVNEFDNILRSLAQWRNVDWKIVQRLQRHLLPGFFDRYRDPGRLFGRIEPAHQWRQRADQHGDRQVRGRAADDVSHA